MKKKVLVLGSNSGGLISALTIKARLHGDVEVTVVSPSEDFLFRPSLILVPFGLRSAADITFKVEPTFTGHGIHFVHEAALSIDPDAKTVVTQSGDLLFDYLIIATGCKNDFDAVPGLGPDGNAYTFTTIEDAIKAGEGWRHFLEDPGDIVIAAAQGAACPGAAYEFVLNTAYQLRKAGLSKSVKLTFVTSEPSLEHSRLRGLSRSESIFKKLFGREAVASFVNSAIEYVDEGNVRTVEGTDLPFKYAMVIPPFQGQDVAKNTCLADDHGYVNVRPSYQTDKFDDIYSVGIGAAVTVPYSPSIPVGIQKSGFPTEIMARRAARNIVSQIKGEFVSAEREFGNTADVDVLDAGDNGVILLADRMFPPRKHGVLIPGPQAHLMKLGYEKYFMWKSRNGYVRLP
ncbi:sulfide dehydrogenase [flavocytochrome c] flavoprotein chain precursor [mine drainage metagenome]|uniref:Sulfide dehydrogenase [flavocytochrome c] flavoprotein chain n=1 Tax=mine drainage metagenome TaxID=410659 RepID=A0A1J5Q6Q9_9ZZZZ